MTSNFTHLHVHTQFSLLDGAAKISDLVGYAKELEMESLAITDHGVMYGAIDFYQECKKQGIKPIIGCEVYVTTGSHLERNNRGLFHLILLAENLEGYYNLMKIVSLAQLEGFYYKPRVDKDILRAHSKGIICLSACIAGELPVLTQQDNLDGARRCLEEHIEIFGKENYFLEIQNHDLPEEHKVNRALKQLAKEYGLGLVATNDLHYVRREDAEAQDVLLCLQTGSTVDEPNRMRFPNDQFYLKSYKEMAEVFPDCPEALENTNIIAERCNVELEFGHLLLPEFTVPEPYGAKSYLRHLCEESLAKKYPNADKVVLDRLDFELQIIGQMGYDCYFLIVWDFIEYCRRNKILVGPGRGSAAGSIVAYLLGITNIEPLRYNLLFERFLNPERVSMPDIDTDFCYVNRDKVLDYVVRRYGQERVAQIVTFGTLQARAAVRDVARALGYSYSVGDKVAKMIPKELGISLEKSMRVNNDLRELYESDPEVHRLIDLAKSVEGMPRNVGTHAAGVIIAPADLKNYVPLQLGVEGSVITQYDKDKLEGLGLLKMDFLGLRTLTVIGDAINNIYKTTGEVVDIDNIPLDDKKTCEMLRNGDTYGVFQLESAGITRLVVDLEPESFEDLIPLVALYRPGPLGTGMAEDFIAGRHGNRTAEILHPLMEPILKDTYGVILYQEQVMQITSALGGFTLGQADILRRAMGKKKAKELDSMREDFVKGAKKLHDIPVELSEKVFSLLQHFAGYGFNKSHSVAYALVAYQTAYLKAHWPAEYMAAFLDSVISDADKISWYIAMCRKSGIQILPPDVNESGSTFTVHKGNSIRFGLAGIKSVGEAAVSTIIATRTADGEFKSLVDFCKRVNMRVVNKRVLEGLILCGAMDSFGVKRSQLMAILDRAVELGASYQKDNASGQMGLFTDENDFSDVNEIALPDLDEMPRALIQQNEKQLIGFYVTGHPLDDYREALKKYTPLYTLMDDDTLYDGKSLQVAGITTSCVIRNTRQGDSMAVLTLEDLTGKMDVLVFPKTYRNFSKEIYQDNIVAVEGYYSVDERESKVVAYRVKKLAKADSVVRLKIAPHLENALVQRELKRVFDQYRGDDEVYLHLEKSKKIIKTNSSFWVNSSKAGFKEEITKILGPDCFI